VAVLADGRVVSGGADKRLVLWEPAASDVQPNEGGRYDRAAVAAVAALPGGRVVSGGCDGRVLLWEASEPGSQPVELGRHDTPLRWRCCRTGGW
jgi:hypothetical protein